MLIKRVQEVHRVQIVRRVRGGIELPLTKIDTALIHSVETARFHWFWRQYGHGGKLLFAFHGFNRSPEDFHSFEKLLGNEYTIVAFDLLFHGKSVLKGNEAMSSFNRDELKEVIELVLAGFGKKEFSVIGHSFGGRLCMNCIEIFEDRVQGLYLMAPDAMRFNPGYWFASHTRPGRMIMKRYRHNPGPVLKFMKLLSKLGFYSHKAMDFYISHLTHEPIREKVYKVWMAHRHTDINRSEVTSIIRKKGIPTLLFFGKYDSVIPPPLGKRFADEAGPTASLHLIETGHRLYEHYHEISEVILKHRK